jgi:hypothetical protein
MEQKAHSLIVDLPHSGDCVVAAFPAEVAEAFLKDHDRTLAYFGCIPTPILCDKWKIAVPRVLGGEKRRYCVAELLSIC